MKILYAVVACLILLSCSPGGGEISASQNQVHVGQDSDNEPGLGEPTPSSFDAALAQEVGADQYGMSSFIMALLKAGPNRQQDSLEAARLQRAHLDNMKTWAEDGKLVLAGPFLDNGELRGIYIFNVDTVEEAKALVETDPAIQAGSLVMELKPWYGSAAVKKVFEIHETIAKEKI